MTKFKFNVGDKVTITGTKETINHSPVGWNHCMAEHLGNTFQVKEQRDDHGEYYKLAGISWNWPVDALTLATEASKAKPRVRIKASGRRQFDVAFKQMVVREYNALPQNDTYKKGVHELLKKYAIGMTRLTYWRKQHSQGHFSAERAVAFSRKDTMVHG